MPAYRGTAIFTFERLKQISLAFLLLSIVITTSSVFSQERNDERSIGTVSSLAVHPANFTSEDWFNPEESLQLDLSDDALFQQFSKRNAAYVPTVADLQAAAEERRARSVNEAVPAQTDSDSVPESGTDLSVPIDTQTNMDTFEGSTEGDNAPGDMTEGSEGVNIEPEPEPESEPEPEPQFEPVPQSPPPVPEEVSVYDRASSMVYTAFSRVFDVFAYASASTSFISETQPESEPAVLESPLIFESIDIEPAVPDPDPVEPPLSTLEDSETELAATVEDPSHTPEGSPTTTPAVPDLSSDEALVRSQTASTAAPVAEASNQAIAPELERHSITFNDFSIPELAPGEFITGLQLRASLAAQYAPVASTTLPYFEFKYVTPSSTQNVGTVLVDGEVSNALNGGYFLFALPSIETEAELDNVSIEVSFVGQREFIEAVFFDAVWLEVHTEKITRQDLVERTNREIMRNLGTPTANEFISERLNFTRNESPVFNLRYVSQRSAVVRSVRSLLGYNKVKISRVELLHGGMQTMAIKPKVNVTSDGLISITFPEEEMRKLKPGQYTVRFEVDEGGYTFSDGFDFEWGMLAINPDQTEYEAGETALLSMGALTPNGNTLCNADLRLYVIDPEEFIHKVPVEESGLCNGNNVIDVPDYTSVFETTVPGTYELYLERLAEDGTVIAHTSDTFEVVTLHDLSIKRTGPTRIYPVAPYEMTLTVASEDGFDGLVTERVPAGFVISDTDALIESVGEFIELTWKISLFSNDSVDLRYTFDAPDISPYLYELGPAVVDGTAPVKKAAADPSATSSEISLPIKQNIKSGFTEHRAWQIASDAVGNMIIYWDNPSYIPTNWNCISCAATTSFTDRFAVGSSTYNNTGGSATHSHTASASVPGPNEAAVSENSTPTSNISQNSHTHTMTPTVVATSSLPAYLTLRVLEYVGNAGEPPTIPAGAIAIFDVASSSLPANWFRYSALDGRYPYGANTVGNTGGDNDHAHDVTGTTDSVVGSVTRNRSGGVAAALNTHTHTISTTTPDRSIEPPYLEVLFARLGATSSTGMPNNAIAMWTEDVPTTGWEDVSSATDAPFNNRFIKGAITYGSTGGTSTHSHANMTGILSSTATGQDTVRSGTTNNGSSINHTHTVSVTNFSTVNHLPPYVSVVFGKKQGGSTVFDQLSFRWYNNDTNEPPTDPWPPGGTLDIAEGTPITATSTTVSPDDILRLRINALVSNATSTATTSVRLQYAAADICTTATTWFNVGSTSSSTALWRGYDNARNDGATLSSTVLASSTIEQSYIENGLATSSPNVIGVDGVGEWDFVLRPNGAAAGTNYCFRLANSDGNAIDSYSSYPQLLTNQAPLPPTLDELFDNEKTASTTGMSFRFTATDPESESLTYQIQIDDDYAFGSTLEDRNTISNAAQFENETDTGDKAPFTSGHIIRFDAGSTFVNGTTYYWRVRAADPNGSNEWGDWSDIYSFTIDTTLLASAWFQTTDEQFDSNTLSGVASNGSDQAAIIAASSTGTMTSDDIVFAEGKLGTVWDSFVFNDTENSGDIQYTIQYLDDSNTWLDIPTGDLPGNGSIDTSPVSLLGLDVETYDTLRIVADFTEGPPDPVLSDWTINWGYLVETPTIAKLFNNEKTGTTTPIFEFTTTDPQGDGLVYQISWSTDNTFATGSTTRTSDVDVGFENIDNGSQVSPIATTTSGDDIRFTIQSGDALTNGVTYWWRVRAKDPDGDDAWSFWTDAQSFTVDTTVVASTWFQTTQEQFDTDILSGTIALGNDSLAVATTAREAMVVYGEGTLTAPRYRTWNGTSWSSEGAMQDIAAPVQWLVVEESPVNEEYIAVSQGTDLDINAQVYRDGVWDDLFEMTANVGNTGVRGFDVAYETNSGDALVVYCDNAADPNFRVWGAASSSWTTNETLINVSETTNCEWIQLASDPASDEIIMLMRGSDGSPFEAQVWDGSAWGNPTTLGNVAEPAHEGMTVAYEESGNQALVVVSNGAPSRFAWSAWSGAGWSAAANVTIDDELEWGELVPDDGSDELALCYQDEDTNIGLMRWSGTAWNTFAATDEVLTTTGKAKNEPGFSCAFEVGGTRDNDTMIVYTDTTQTNYSYWDDSAASMVSGGQINSMGDTITSQLIRTSIGLLLGVFFDETNDQLLFSSWNGSNWSTTTIMESDVSVNNSPYGKPYDIIPRTDGTEGTVIAAPGINFTDGSGPYWQEMSWSDTTPVGTDILYSVQYWDGDSWEFIPNSEIPNNDIGTSTGTIDLSGLNKNTYSLIRPYAVLSCATPSSCPLLHDWTVTWAEGITVSGSIDQYDQTTPVNSGTVAVAVNGVLQAGKTGTITTGAWSIANVTVFPGDVVTVFVSDTADSSEAVGVTRYDGIGDIGGMALFERHVSLGSYDATSTPLTNIEIGAFDYTNDEDVFFGLLSTTTLDLCVDVGCGDVELYIASTSYYRPGGYLHTHDIEINGTLVSTSTLFVSGSWDNNGTSTLTNGTVVMAATSTAESIDTTGAVVGSFYNLIFGTTTTASATWTLATTLDVNNDLSVNYGTLARGATPITVAGDLTTGASGYWTGQGTTTFDGSTPATWSDSNATTQNVGRVVINGTNKAISLGGNVAAQSLTIGGDDTLDVTVGNHTLTIYEGFTNYNNFLPRQGTVIFAATSSTYLIADQGDGFFNLSFTGGNGAWAFASDTVSVGNDLTIATGTLTLANGTTTVGGSFTNSGGMFGHGNAVVAFTSASAETITTSGDAFNNLFYDLYFNGGGSWTFTETNATTTNNLFINAGTVIAPTGVLGVGGSFTNVAGAFTSGSGTVDLFSNLDTTVTAFTSSFNHVLKSGTGTTTALDTNLTLTGDLTIDAGTFVAPAGTLTIGGSLTNNALFTAGTGEVLFNSTDVGETIDFGVSPAYDLTFRSTSGGWTIVSHATATNDFTLASSSDFTLSSGQVLSVGTSFTNSVGGASTTWSGSTLSLTGGTYSINPKTNQGDAYENLLIGAAAAVSMWNSQATTTTVVSGGYLYSQDHAGADGDLYIYGDYTRSSGTEYWSYATDFDGTSLTGSERTADVRFASGASASFTGSTLRIVGGSTASTTIANQGSGTYTVTVSGGTTTAQYYDFADLGGSGVSLLASTTVTSLSNGHFTVAQAGGTALTIATSTIEKSPGKQIQQVGFATTTAIAAFNVTSATSTSYWWFRNSYGNLDGESFDNDDGNPGSIRWDDSALVLTISGHIYSDDGATLLGGLTCDGDANQPVTVVVENGATYTGSCTATSSYSVSGVTVVGDPTLTVYLNGADGGETAVAVSKTPTADIADMDLYVNRVIVRHEDVSPMTIAAMAAFDNTDDPAGINFTAATGTTDSLTVEAGNELYVWHGKTFEPGGTVTLAANATANSYDGTLHLGSNATFTGAGTTTYTIGGSLDLESGATFVPASSTILMIATTTGKTVTASATGTIDVYDISFTGAGGGWNINGDVLAGGDIYVATGTVTGTADITLSNGSFYGDGLLSLGAGTTTIEATNTLGGTQAWTFYDLTLGSGLVVGTTTPASAATTTVLGRLTIATAHFLDAGTSQWDLSGSGTVFVENGTFLEDTSSVTYSGSGATSILSTDYYDLTLSAIGGSPTYTATGLGIQVFGDMQVGGATATNVNFDTNDPALNVDGNFTITSNGTFIASATGVFTVAGSFDNNGTYTASGGTIVFDGSGTHTIAAGSSNFATALLLGTGTYTVTEHATATTFTIGAGLSSFTLASGQTLAVGGTFTNSLGGTATTFTGSTLSLYGGGNYLINPATSTENYDTLTIGANTQIRTWGTVATTTNTLSGASLYSQDHGNQNGDLYIFGEYVKSSGIDHWSYAKDFDGSDISGSPRQVDVYVIGGGSVTYQGTSQLSVLGNAAASTTIQNQGTGVFALTATGTASTTMNYHVWNDLDSDGLTFGGSVIVRSLSYGSFVLASDGYSALTVTGSALNASPARTFTLNRFVYDTGVTTGANVTTVGSSVSSWRFTNHYGDYDGESFDADDGDPGYIVWDDSIANISISGTVYDTDEATVSNVCPGATVRVRVAGLTTYDGVCNGSGVYSVSGVTYSPGDSIVAYILGETENGATVTVDPVSNIGNFDIYENRLIVRHEGTNPITIDNIAVWDSSDVPADLDFTAVSGSPDTLTLAADTKLIVWTDKEFAPGGNVTVPGGGAGSAFDGTIQLQTDAVWTSVGTEVHTIGGSLISETGAVFTAGNSTTTFTTTGASRTVDTNDYAFYNLEFTGSGSWTVTNTTLDANNILITNGAVTLPTGTTTVSGFFALTGGTFAHNGGQFNFDGSGAGNTVQFGGSTAGQLTFSGSGSWNMTDINATSTGGVTITDGTVSLPSGTLALSDSFRNESGAVTHNTSEIRISTSTTASVMASSSDLYAVTFAGGGTFAFVDQDLTLLDDLTLLSGNLGLASGTLSIGGSFDASGGTFNSATGSVLFNSTDTGETIDPGSSSFYNVVFGSATGGWTITANATTSNIFSLTSAASFTLQSGSTLYVGGVFSNDVLNSVTTWTGSTLILDSGTSYEVNDKTTGDNYETLQIGADMDLSMWNSAATTTVLAAGASLYSQDHNNNNGYLNIYGDYHIATTTEYWSYATDFDGTDLTLTSGERPVTVSIASGATTTVDGGTLNIIGTSGNVTTITNQGSGQYGMAVSAGTINAQYYAFRNLNATGLDLSGTPTITSLSYGDYELAVSGGRLINLSSTTLNYNASLVIPGTRFATTSAITGTNVYLTGSTINAWTFTTHTGNLSGENYDVDGATQCGSVRWSDSNCQLLEMTHFRWRNDDGGLGVPDSEWYDTNWSKRVPVRIDNNDANEYTDAVVEVSVLYDADMQIDFDDLRFTDETGTNTIPHFIASTTNSASAEVWVKVPTLPASETATVYMYYGNATATTTSSSTLTFLAADDFEDGNIVEYTGAGDDKNSFSVTGSFAYGNTTYGLDNSGDPGGHADQGGIARFDQDFGRGSSTLGVTIRYMQYVDTAGADNEVCTLFAVQSPVSNSENYAVCTEQVIGADYITLSEDIVDTDVYSGVSIASTTVTYSTGWYEVEVDWETDGDMTVTLYDDNETQVAQVSGNDSTYTKGAYGFTYWSNDGGWDNFTVRPLLTTEPAVRFGAESVRGGASWAAAEDTVQTVVPNATTRLRLAIENSGLATTSLNFDLEYAAKGGAPSCESVSGASYTTVPNQVSCGSSPLCMQTTTHYVNGAATTDLLLGTAGLFTPGDAVESPSNTTGNIDIDEDYFTELEYAITSTNNAVSSNYCLRVTNSGDELDTYLEVAELIIRFDPTFGAVSFNNGENISLLPGTTTRVYATATVTDLNGYTDIVAASSTMYTTTATAACSDDDNNCYIETIGGNCSLTNCSGNSCVLECYSDVYFHADPTFSDGGNFWQAFLEASDAQGGTGFNTSASIDVLELAALTADGAIDYGALEVTSTTTAFVNPTTTVQNYGNIAIDISVQGTDLSDGATAEIPAQQQIFATTTFDYDTCVLTTCTQLSTTTIIGYELDLSKPTTTAAAVEDHVFWGIAIPYGVPAHAYTGVNTFYAVTD